MLPEGRRTIDTSGTHPSELSNAKAILIKAVAIEIAFLVRQFVDDGLNAAQTLCEQFPQAGLTRLAGLEL